MSEKNANDVMAEAFGIFGQKPEEIETKEVEQESGVSMFSPDPKLAEDGVWKGLIKFLPNVEDPKHPLVRKVSYWVIDPRDDKGTRYDSAKSNGKYEDCIIADKYFKWKDCGDARLEKFAKNNLQYGRKCFALVQIVKDFQNADNNGKILVFNVPKKIQDMIDSKMYPSDADIEMGSVAENVFDPFNAPLLVVKAVLKKTDAGEFRNWDKCEWHKQNASMMLNDGTEEEPKFTLIKEIPTEAEELKNLQTKVITALTEAPKISEFKYNGNSEAIETKVREILAVMEGEPINAEKETAKPEAETAKSETETKKPEAEKTETKESKSSDSLVDDLLAD